MLACEPPTFNLAVFLQSRGIKTFGMRDVLYLIMGAGHHDIGGAGGGITSMRHPTLAPVVQCLLGESDTPLGASSDTSSGSSTASNSTGSGAAALSCPPPDVVVVNSGMHDAYGGRDVEPKFQVHHLLGSCVLAVTPALVHAVRHC